MNAVKDEVRKLVQKELHSANKQFPLFSSPHEGWAVMAEEVEETEDAARDMHAELNSLWRKVRMNEEISGEEMIYLAIDCACEAIQAAAMGMKLDQSAEHWTEEEIHKTTREGGKKYEEPTRRKEPETQDGCCCCAPKICQCAKCARQAEMKDNGEGCCDWHKKYTHDAKDGGCYIKGCPDFVQENGAGNAG